MTDKKMEIYGKDFFSRIKRFLNSIFYKKTEDENKNRIVFYDENKAKSQKKKFREYISFREDKKELKLIKSVRNNINILNKMSFEELDQVERAILNRMNYVDKRILKLETDIKMKKMQI